MAHGCVMPTCVAVVSNRTNEHWPLFTALYNRYPAAKSLPLRIHALRIGDVAVVGAEGELFCHYQHVLERTSPARFTLAAGYAQVCQRSVLVRTFAHSFTHIMLARAHTPRTHDHHPPSPRHTHTPKHTTHKHTSHTQTNTHTLHVV